MRFQTYISIYLELTWIGTLRTAAQHPQSAPSQLSTSSSAAQAGLLFGTGLPIEKSSNSLSRSGVAENPGKADGWPALRVLGRPGSWQIAHNK